MSSSSSVPFPSQENTAENSSYELVQDQSNQSNQSNQSSYQGMRKRNASLIQRHSA